MNNKKIFLSIIIVVIIVMVMVFYLKNIREKTVASKEKALAKCLTEKGAVMYGSKYCGWCKKQKELFGDAFQFIKYVECTESNLCEKKNIAGVPTWEINGRLYTGLKTLDELAELAGC